MTLFDSTLSSLQRLTGNPLAVAVLCMLWIAALLAIKSAVLSRASKLAQRSATRMDDVLAESLDFPLTILILASGATWLHVLLDLGPKAEHLLLIFLKACVLLAAMAFGNKLVDSLVKHYGHLEKIKVLSGGIMRGLAKALIAALGTLIFLDMLGVSITPILASLGIGSLAVALALQDTLSNLFAGIHLLVDKPLRLGDFVRLESGQEGIITEIGWRSTRLKTPQNNIVVLPNNKLTSSVLTNFFLPDKSTAVPVEVGVSYGSDLQRVERITLEVAKYISLNVAGTVRDFDATVRFHTFADSSINGTVVLAAQDFRDLPLIKHEFLKALHKKFQEEKIVIPFPTRTLDIPQGLLNGPTRDV